MKSLRTQAQKGYIALMATIIISLMLLVMVGQESFSGSSLRFVVLGIEDKEQSSSLAEGCAEVAVAALASDPAYAGDITMSLAADGGGAETCYIAPILRDTPAVGQTTIKAQAAVRGAFTTIEAVIETTSGAVVSWREIPHLYLRMSDIRR